MFTEVLFTQVTRHAYLAQYYLLLQMPSVFTIIILLLLRIITSCWGGYIFPGICLVFLFVCLLATSHKSY